MKNKGDKTLYNNRKDERGAALVTVLLISFLLLAGVTALMLESSMNTANVTDATSEEQAYYAAESGIQSVIDALRHNPRPNPLLDPSKSPLPPDPDADEANQIDYSKVIRRETSNRCTKTGMSFTCADPLDNAPNDLRLSRWLNYNWGPNGGASASSKDRIVLGDPATYSPLNGFAYSVKVYDPDNTGGTVTYSISASGNGLMEPLSGNYVGTRTFGLPPNTTTVEYVPPTGNQTVDVSTGSGNGNIGSFRITHTGTGAAPPSGDGLVRFRINVAVSQPQVTYMVIRGYIMPAGPALRSTATSTCARPSAAYLFDSPAFIAFGSRISLTNSGCQVEEEPTTHTGPFGTYLTGYLVQPEASGGELPLMVNITQPQPTRLMVKSTGYGPFGARKELETIIQKNYFNGLGAPSPLTLIGPPCNRPPNPVGACVPGPPPFGNGGFNFEPGNSKPIFYSGKDKKLKVFLPPIGLTNDPNKEEVKARIASGFNGAVYGSVENVGMELPYWLQNPKNLDDTVQLLKAAAQSAGTYWGPASSPPTNGTGVYGDWANATGISFVDKDVTISGDAGGILIVTGSLTFKGNFRFNGLVLITGAGGFIRNGGGNGELAGNMIVAPYNNWSKTTCMGDPLITNKLDCYLTPWYEISGGGTSDLLFNSQSVTNGLSGLGNFVKGVAEK